jgi:hypothetical protein
MYEYIVNGEVSIVTIMRSKADLYHVEQSQIISKIADYLTLTDTPTHILYDLDQNDKLKKNIMSLSLDIKKYYNCNNLKAVTDPSRIKRPWLSIIKTLLNPYYEIVVEDYHFTQKDPVTNESKYIHSQKYSFQKKNCLFHHKKIQKYDSPDGVDQIDGIYETDKSGPKLKKVTTEF